MGQYKRLGLKLGLGLRPKSWPGLGPKLVLGLGPKLVLVLGSWVADNGRGDAKS